MQRFHGKNRAGVQVSGPRPGESADTLLPLIGAAIGDGGET